MLKTLLLQGLTWLADPAHLTMLVGPALGLLGGLSFMSARRRKLVALATYHAYHVVEDLTAQGLLPAGATKVQAGLQAADQWMAANGWRELKPGEQEVAKLSFSAMHGAALLAQKVAAPAPAGAVSPPTPLAAS